jgi:hypothetical protein
VRYPQVITCADVIPERRAAAALPLAQSTARAAHVIVVAMTATVEQSRTAPRTATESAEIHDAVIVHYDRDFDTIAAVTGQESRWLVPAGSID